MIEEAIVLTIYLLFYGLVGMTIIAIMIITVLAVILSKKTHL